MDIIVLKSFLPEIFLSLCILVHFVFNIFLIKQRKNNFPLIDKEHLSQCFFIISCCLLLVYKVCFSCKKIVARKSNKLKLEIVFEINFLNIENK